LLIGLTISALAPNNDWAISFIPIILIPQVIFAGAIIPFKDWLTQIMAVGFPTRWALAALCSSIGVHSDKIGKDRLFGDDYTYHGTLFSIYTHQEAVTRNRDFLGRVSRNYHCIDYRYRSCTQT